MFALVKRLLGSGSPSPQDGKAAVAADPVVCIGSASFDLRRAADQHEGFLHPHWPQVEDWLHTLPDAERAPAWLACERAWLLQLRDALGGGYSLHESADGFLLSAQSPRTAAVTLQFLDTTLRRVRRLLESLASPAELGKEILVVFASEDDYYRYVGHYYPDDGEFAMSSGMFLSSGCGHFVVHGEELSHFEPTIVHEMTHSQLSHLPIPAWLNEGMAVNSEQRLTRIGADAWSVQQLEDKHRRFWTQDTIQEFWSGAAFLRPDEGSELAYDLGRLMVNGLSSDWQGFQRFASAAHLSDAGAAAAHGQLQLDLGEFVRHFLGRDDGDWGPAPSRWPSAPQRGQFRGLRRAGIFLSAVACLLVALAWPALAAPVVAAPSTAAPERANDDDGPYVRYVGDGLEVRWVCGGEVQLQRIAKVRWPQALAPRCGFDRALEIRGRATLDAPARITGARRLVALSDTHGQYALVRRLLQANGIVDAKGRWSYGSGHLVMTGDVFDRGPQVNEILWLLYTLEQEAREVGGAVDFVLGNHESLVLRDDLRYVHEKYRRNAERLGTPYPALYGPDTVLGDWLRSKRTVLQVDELLFVHGGLGPAFLALGLDLDQANVRSRASLGLSREQLRADPVLAAMQDGVDSPIWYRGYFMDPAMTEARVQEMLRSLGAERVVVGHTSQPHVQSRFDGRVIAIDSSIKEGASGELLFREDGVLSRGLLDGSRVPVEAGATPTEAPRAESHRTPQRSVRRPAGPVAPEAQDKGAWPWQKS